MFSYKVFTSLQISAMDTAPRNVSPGLQNGEKGLVLESGDHLPLDLKEFLSV